MELKELDYKDRVINLFDDIDEESVKNVIEKIVNINIQDTEYISTAAGIIGRVGFKVDPSLIDLPPITINLSTFGGICYDGMALCDSIRTSDTAVKIVCYGKIMSMGIPILLSAKYKVAHKNTTFMIHGISSACWGKAEFMRDRIEETNRLEKMVCDYIIEHSKFPKKKMNDIIKNQKDYYFTVEEALQYKIIDEIIE